MSHLKLIRIEIQGFRKFRDPWVLDLLSPADEALDYLVLAGPNGCGKTTVLEAILLALGREELIVRDLDSKDRATSPRVGLELGAVLTAVVHDQTTDETCHFIRTSGGLEAKSPLADGSYSGMSLQQPESWLAPLGTEYISSRRLPALVGSVQDGIKGRPPDNTEANRIWRLKHRVRQQQGRRVPGYTGPEPLDQQWMERLNDFWQAFRGDGTHLTMTLVDPDDLDASEWDLILYDGDRRVCSVDALSSGEQEIIAMVAPFITEPFDGLLLIDEPELHLHPQWQGRVLRALRTVVPQAQVIVATHADDPWDDAMSWERRLLVDEDDPRARMSTEGAG